MKSKKNITILLIILLFSATSFAATLAVKQNTGGYYSSITAAYNAAASGDTILICDSEDYYENLTITKDNITIKGHATTRPTIQAYYGGSWGAAFTINANNTYLENLNIYPGGARYGINKIGPGNLTVIDCSFEFNIASGSGAVYAVRIADSSGTNTINDCVFFSNDNVTNGGIWVDTVSSVTLNINQCDFWGVGNSAGCIGLGVTNSGSISVTNSIFSNWRWNNLIGINSWGSGSITINESDNTYYDVQPMASRVNGGSINWTSQQLSGNAVPSDCGVQIDMGHINNLLNYFGVLVKPDSTLQNYTGPSSVPISNWLRNCVRWHGYFDFQWMWDSVQNDYLGNLITDFYASTGANMIENYEFSWDREYSPDKWALIKENSQNIHDELPDLMLTGFCMDAIGKTNTENTLIPNKLFCWMSRWTADVCMRPMQVRVVRGIRRVGRFFDYDIMLGWGQNYWGTNVSVPNINKQEALMYYLYLIREMTNAGMNCISFAQPQITFGQSNTIHGYGGDPFKMCTKFAKNYGYSTNAYTLQGKKFNMVLANTIVYYLKNYCNFIDCVVAPVAANSIGSGLYWNSLSDSWNTIPPSSVGVSGKPIMLMMDNSAPNDQISVFAAETPANRNTWLCDFHYHVKTNYGYYFSLPGWTALTPVGCQDFTGYTATQTNYPHPWFFCAWDIYSGCESTMQYLFSTTY